MSCRRTEINLRQTKNHSAENDFSFGAEKKCVMTRSVSTSLQGTAEIWAER
ncbi:conserved domain protein [Paraprevotella xylaniphila YIT 11841]|uniref:Conserved domain protein n=1 Tax=Paraprevotella xylaniphila YIT 11841 TaxID=762982 RepID=F3QZ22_9BACT|nr:conserved domain protein [Paraprevotella xylaniphila YIT 11841]